MNSLILLVLNVPETFARSKWLVKRLIEIIILQIDVDIGSSTVANGVLGLVCGVITTLVVDMAFLVQVWAINLSFFKVALRSMQLCYSLNLIT